MRSAGHTKQWRQTGWIGWNSIRGRRWRVSWQQLWYVMHCRQRVVFWIRLFLMNYSFSGLVFHNLTLLLYSWYLFFVLLVPFTCWAPRLIDMFVSLALVVGRGVDYFASGVEIFRRDDNGPGGQWRKGVERRVQPALHASPPSGITHAAAMPMPHSVFPGEKGLHLPPPPPPVICVWRGAWMHRRWTRRDLVWAVGWKGNTIGITTWYGMVAAGEWCHGRAGEEAVVGRCWDFLFSK